MIVWTECNKVHEYESMKYKHQLFVAILRVGRDFDFFRQVYNKFKKNSILSKTAGHTHYIWKSNGRSFLNITLSMYIPTQ